MLNSTLLMSSARFFGNDHKLNPYYEDGATVDTAKAETEHRGIMDALRRAGSEIVTVDAPQYRDGPGRPTAPGRAGRPRHSWS